MGGEGSMQAMRNILKNNKMLLRKKSYFRKEKSFLNLRIEYYNSSDKFVDYNQATKEDLLAIRKKIIRQRRIEMGRSLLLFLILISVLVFIFIRVFAFSTTSQPLPVSKAEQHQLKQFDYYLKDGDQYLEKGQWHNAIFQYKKAIELFPANYTGQYRLAYAYTYRCRNTKTNCTIAERKVKALLDQFPEQHELLELETVLMFVKE